MDLINKKDIRKQCPNCKHYKLDECYAWTNGEEYGTTSIKPPFWNKGYFPAYYCQECKAIYKKGN